MWKYDKNGLSLADVSELLEETQQLFLSAFPDINLDPSTPQGQIITGIVENLADVQSQVVYFANVFLNGGAGIWLDNWANTFYGITRKSATPAIANLLATGVPNTVIPAGFKCSGSGDKLWTSKIESVIGIDGNGTISVHADDIKTTQALPNTIKNIVTVIPGLERITNLTASSAPIQTESDAEFYSRAKSYSSYFPSTSMFGSGLAQLANIVGVTKVGGFENMTDYPSEWKGYILPAHSVNYIVKDGSDVEIASVLLKTKNPGCDMGGEVTVPIAEVISGQIYDVSFFRPIDAPLKAVITIQVSSSADYDFRTEIFNNLSAYISGLAFGSSIFPVNVVSEIGTQQVKIVNFAMSRLNEEPSLNVIDLKFTENASIAIENVSFVLQG